MGLLDGELRTPRWLLRQGTTVTIDSAGYFSSDRTAVRAIVRASWGFTDTAAIAKITLKSVVTGSSGVYPFARIWKFGCSSNRLSAGRCAPERCGHSSGTRPPPATHMF